MRRYGRMALLRAVLKHQKFTKFSSTWITPSPILPLRSPRSHERCCKQGDRRGTAGWLLLTALLENTPTFSTSCGPESQEQCREQGDRGGTAGLVVKGSAEKHSHLLDIFVAPDLRSDAAGKAAVQVTLVHQRLRTDNASPHDEHHTQTPDCSSHLRPSASSLPPRKVVL